MAWEPPVTEHRCTQCDPNCYRCQSNLDEFAAEVATAEEAVAATRIARNQIARQELRDSIALAIEAHATDDSDVSDAYRHAAMIAKGTL